MALTIVTAPAIEPITIAEAKAHLRLDSSGSETAPEAPTVALISPAVPGNVNNGVHRYRVTFVTADGETEGGTISDAVTVADKTVNGKVTVSAIPIGGGAVTSRKLYRTVAGGSEYLLLATIADNVTTTYTDNIADASLGAGCPSTNTTEDPTLTALIKAARQAAEARTQRALITQSWELALDSFPLTIYVPLPPLQSPLTSIKYIDTDGTEQTLAAANYRVDYRSEPARITPAYGLAWPSTRSVTNAVVVAFDAGYGDAAADVPQQIRQAILMILAHYYEHRESVMTRGPGQGDPIELPLGAEALLWPYSAVTF